MNNRKTRQRYLKKVRSYLPCSGKVKNQIMEQITESVDGYLTEQPEAGYEQIVARFGEPQTIAAAYVESTGTAEILRALQIRRRIVAIVAGVMAAILLSWAVVVTWAVIREKGHEPGSYSIVIQNGAALPADAPHWSSSEGQILDETGG